MTDHPIPAVPGIISAAAVRATGRYIADQQERCGAIPWYAPTGTDAGHVNVWDHIEATMALSVAGLTDAVRHAYRWLRDEQRSDGSWPSKWVLGQVAATAAESNHAAYVATGVWHEWAVTGDRTFTDAMWPTVKRAIGFVLDLQAKSGEVCWIRDADGRPGDLALLTGCSSIYHSLRCAVALAELVGDPQPDWELSAQQLGHAIAAHPERFADKERFAMDWYYPILCGAVRGPAAAARLADGWNTFLVPGLGCLCVSDEPWVTGAETCELVLALDAVGDRASARDLFATIQHLRHDDGSYWTGYQYVDGDHWPGDRSTYTAAAVILAADALSESTPAARMFAAIGGQSMDALPHVATSACGCSARRSALNRS